MSREYGVGMDDDARAWLNGDLSSDDYFTQAWEREWSEARREVQSRLRRRAGSDGLSRRERRRLTHEFFATMGAVPDADSDEVKRLDAALARTTQDEAPATRRRRCYCLTRPPVDEQDWACTPMP